MIPFRVPLATTRVTFAALPIPLVALAALWCLSGPANAQMLGMAGRLPDLQKVDISSPHIYDYTFAIAPTDWVIASGIWDMTNRWSCSPGWNWFGGRSDEIAAIWNKRHLAGDQSAQVFCAFKMDMPDHPSEWWEYPSDIAVTICGDGKNVTSGYTFIAGADNNSHSVLLRHGKVVQDSHQVEDLLTAPIDKYPDDTDQHRHWWSVRVDRVGPVVQCRLDNRLIFQYKDPQPLPGGQTSIWTYNNGIMLARVILFFEREVKPVFHSEGVRVAAAP